MGTIRKDVRELLEFKSRVPKNKAEEQLVRQLSEAGWKMTRRGWPDIFAWKDGKIALIEVKRGPTQKLKPSQLFIMQQFKKRGIPCFWWTPAKGLMKIPKEPRG